MDYERKVTLLGVMVSFKGICDSDVRYARSARILWCWWKASILRIEWETDIENVMGRSWYLLKIGIFQKKIVRSCVVYFQSAGGTHRRRRRMGRMVWRGRL